MKSKSQLRKEFKKLRDTYTGEAAAIASEKICGAVLNSPDFKSAGCIFSYAPLGSEVDIRKVTAAAWTAGKTVAFPRVQGDTMQFYAVSDFNELRPGTFGVAEPAPTGSARIRLSPETEAAALILVPGLVFDRNKNRMGYGKGYYDRYFAGHTDCTLFGIAYSFQITDLLPAEAHDRQMDAVVTEHGIFL